MNPTVYEARPFQNRNADDYDLPDVLDLFIDPVPELEDPFSYENSIVKGRMGSGKTMFLRANHAYHLFGIIPSLMDEMPPTIPVSIKLNDFQHLTDPQEIYSGIIIKMVKGLIKAYKDIQSADRMIRIHQGIQALPEIYTNSPKLPAMFNKLIKLTSSEYSQTITSHFAAEAGVKGSFIEAAAKYERELVTQIKTKTSPSIEDLHDAYEHLLAEREGRILLLIDEAGSLGRAFFTDGGGVSLFETLMNQLRTTGFLRTKIAIYPNTPADILFETRYGDLVELTENVVDDVGYAQFRKKALKLIERYASRGARNLIRAHEIFELDLPENQKDDAVEQALYASGGNMRRLVQILDQSMVAAFSDHKGNGPVTVKHVTDALKRQSHAAECVYSESDMEFLNGIAKVCHSRGSFQFQFPYKSPALFKYISKSEEYNLLNIVEAGGGRRKTTYAFDYAYCVNHDIPTHHIKDSERLDKTRSRKSGQWINRAAQISEELLLHAKLLNKLNGQIGLLSKQSGYITDESGKEYWFLFRDVMDGESSRLIVSGKKVLFYPAEFNGSPMAVAIEIL
jgi:hypothetical protein